MLQNTKTKKPKLIGLLSIILILIATACGAPPQERSDISGQPPTPPSPGANSAGGDADVPTGTGGCEEFASAFESTSDLVTVTCDDTYMYVSTETGLPHYDADNPDHRIMVGITAWILRVPVPYEYNWKIPLNPQFLTDYEEASAKGPIAFAVDGVPIFHPERRPDVSTLPSNYDPGSDTVLQGELDQCGGHAGQGDDYHYHYVPICLLHDHDMSQPIAFGLDGIPVYFGTGGDDFYGNGEYTTLNNLPEGELDECNGYQLPDGTYVYYTTSDFPYMIGCHHAHFDPSLQIEPRPMNGRDQGASNPYGGAFGEPTQTLVMNYYVDEDGWYHLEHTAFNGNGTNAVVFRASSQGNDCWDFQYRVDADTSTDPVTYCR